MINNQLCFLSVDDFDSTGKDLMPLVKVRDIYDQATMNGFAVGGFDAEHLYMVKAIIEAAEEIKSPVIIFLWEKDIQMAGMGNLENIVLNLGDKATVPVAMMLDHGTNINFCNQCIQNGHTGIMIDASHYPLDKNIAITKQVVEIAKPKKIFVEGEIGTIARTFEDTGEFSEPPKFTDPDEAVQFATESGVDAMAISIGSASGLYKDTPQLDFELLKQIRNHTSVNLILHGGSGIPADQISKVVTGGVTGIRFATENRLAFFNAMEAKRKDLGLDHPDSRIILRAGADAAKGRILKRMQQMGSAGMA